MEEIPTFEKKHLGRTPMSGLFWCFPTAILMLSSQQQQQQQQKKHIKLLVSTFYLHIFLIPYKVQQSPTIIWIFGMTHTCKNISIAERFVAKNLFSKI